MRSVGPAPGRHEGTTGRRVRIDGGLEMGVSDQGVEASGTTEEWWLTISHSPLVRR
jgi:hypothetical protein